MPPDCKLYKCFLVFFSPFIGGTESLEWAGIGYFSSSSWFSPIIPQQVSFWLTSFSWGYFLLRRAECSGLFRNYPIPSPPQYLLWESGQAPGGKIHKSMPSPLPWLDPPGVFKSQSCPHWASSVTQLITVQVSHWALFLQMFLLQYVFTLCNHLSFSPILGVSGLPYDLTTLKDLRRVVHFSVCLAILLVRRECLLPSSLHTEPETSSPYLVS